MWQLGIHRGFRFLVSVSSWRCLRKFLVGRKGIFARCVPRVGGTLRRGRGAAAIATSVAPRNSTCGVRVASRDSTATNSSNPLDANATSADGLEGRRKHVRSWQEKSMYDSAPGTPREFAELCALQKPLDILGRIRDHHHRDRSGMVGEKSMI